MDKVISYTGIELLKAFAVVNGFECDFLDAGYQIADHIEKHQKDCDHEYTLQELREMCDEETTADSVKGAAMMMTDAPFFIFDIRYHAEEPFFTITKGK